MKLVSIVHIVLLGSLLGLFSCGTKKVLDNTGQSEIFEINQDKSGESIEIKLETGQSHNHPSFSIWIETLDGEFIETVFVTQSIGTGIFGHGSIGDEKWDTKPGPQYRPAALPYWIHKRSAVPGQAALPTPDKPAPDAVTGATPVGPAVVKFKTDTTLPRMFRILLEVNQPWDWNSYWHNQRLDDVNYRSSCQPSMLYAVTINLDDSTQEYYLNPIGHGHPAGKNGKLFTDISTLSSAKEILGQIQVSIQ